MFIKAMNSIDEMNYQQLRKNCMADPYQNLNNTIFKIGSKLFHKQLINASLHRVSIKNLSNF